MTTNEWMGIVFGSVSIAIGTAVFVTRHMINKFKFGAQEADRIRDATIERLEQSEKVFERDISKLNTTVDSLTSKVDSLEGNIKENSTVIFKLKSDVHKLRKISVRHKSLMKKFETTICNQFKDIDSLENKLLDIASNLDEFNEKGTHDINLLKRNVKDVSRAINVVRRSIKGLETNIVSEQKILGHFEES